MADNISVDNGDLTDFTVSTDQGAGGHVQRVKLAYSADGSETHVTADSGGLLVNLGANNDVVASGTVTVGGTPTVTVGGTPSVSIVGGTAVMSGSLAAGSELIGYVGISSDGTAIADMLSLTNGTAVAVGLYDSDGDQLTFASPARIAASGGTVQTSAYAAGDNMSATIHSFAAAAATSAGSGWITKFMLLDKDGEGANWQYYFLNASLTPNAAGTAFSLSDADAEKIEGVVDTTNGEWFAYGGGSVCQVILAPPIPYKLASGTTLYGVARALGTPTYTAGTDLVAYVHVLRD